MYTIQVLSNQFQSTPEVIDQINGVTWDVVAWCLYTQIPFKRYFKWGKKIWVLTKAQIFSFFFSTTWHCPHDIAEVGVCRWPRHNWSWCMSSDRSYIILFHLVAFASGVQQTQTNVITYIVSAIKSILK